MKYWTCLWNWSAKWLYSMEEISPVAVISGTIFDCACISWIVSHAQQIQMFGCNWWSKAMAWHTMYIYCYIQTLLWWSARMLSTFFAKKSHFKACHLLHHIFRSDTWSGWMELSGVSYCAEPLYCCLFLVEWMWLFFCLTTSRCICFMLQWINHDGEPLVQVICYGGCRYIGGPPVCYVFSKLPMVCYTMHYLREVDVIVFIWPL